MTTIANTINTVIGFVRALPGNILSAIGNLGSLLVNAGRDIITGLWNGIVGMGSWLWSNIMNFVRANIPGPILTFLGIASPSKYMRDEIGQHIPTGLAEGILKTAPAAAAASRQMAQNAANAAAAVPLPRLGIRTAQQQINATNALTAAQAQNAAVGGTGTHIENLTINMQAVADLSNPSALSQSAKTFVDQMRQSIRVQEAARS
jgi:phage-related protein